MDTEISKQIEKYRDELIALRRDFHQHPTFRTWV